MLSSPTGTSFVSVLTPRVTPLRLLAGLKTGHYATLLQHSKNLKPEGLSYSLDIEIYYFESVVFDEFAARFDVFTHERGENIFCGDGVFELHLQQRAGVRVHGGFPQLLGVHFAQALESSDGEILFGVFHDVVEDVRGFFPGDFRAVARHGERRMVELLDLLGWGAEPLLFSGRGNTPADLLIVRKAELNFVEAVFLVESNFAFKLEFGLLNFLEKFFQRLLVFEIRFLFKAAFGTEFDEAGFPQAATEFGCGGIVFLHVQKEGGEARTFEIYAFLGFHDVIFGGALHQFAGELAIVADVTFGLAALHAIERRLSDLDMAALDELLHMAEKEREKQSADVRAVDVGVGHQNDFVIAEFAGVEIVLADAGTQRGDDGADFFVAQHFVVAGLFDVEDFAFEGQDGLVFAIAAHLCGPPGRLPRDDKQFTTSRIALLAISQLPREAARIHRGFAAGKFASLAGGLPGARGVNAFADDAAGDGGMFVEPIAELFVDKLLDVALDVAIELAFGLAFELGLRQSNADNCDEAFTNVVAGDSDFVFLLFEHAGVRSEIVDCARQSGAKAGKVGATVDSIDGVGEGEDVFAVGVVVLQGKSNFDVSLFGFHVNRRIVKGGLASVQVLDEFGDAAGEAKFGVLFVPLVGECDLQAFVEEGIFAEAGSQRVVAEGRLFENAWVGMEFDFCAGFAGFGGLLEFICRLSLFVTLLPNCAIALNFEFEKVGKSVDDGNADAVETAGNFVGVTVEFAAGVKNGEDDFCGGTLLGGVHVHGNAAAVVDHGYGVVGMNGDIHFVRIARHCFCE